MENVTNIEDFLSDEKVRESHLDKLEVLDKVKELFTLPNTELMTTKTVAKYYEVDETAIRKLFTRHKLELQQNGAKSLSGQELRDIKSLSGFKTRAKSITVFSKRAVLNVGMLLRDSNIAKQVRTQLLNQQEQLTDDEKVKSIDEEQLLLLKIIQAKDAGERAIALSEYNEYKSRYENELKQQLEEQKPMVEKYGVFVNSESTFSFTDVAKMISTRADNEDVGFTVTSISLPKLLRENGVISKRKSGNSYTNLPNKDYEQYFNVSETHITSNNVDFHKTNVRVNTKGIDFLYDFVKNVKSSQAS